MTTTGQTQPTNAELQERIAQLEQRLGQRRGLLGRLVTRRTPLVMTSIVLALVLGGIAYASIPDSNGVIHGCYATTAASNGTHALSVIDTAKTASCPSGTTALNWNQRGPRGPSGVSNGYTDFNVAQQFMTADAGWTAVAQTGSVAAGNYIATADTTVVPGWNDYVNCALGTVNTGPMGEYETAGAIIVDDEKDNVDYPTTGYIPLTITGSLFVNAGDSIALFCKSHFGNTNTFVVASSISAIQLTTVNATTGMPSKTHARP